MIYPDFPWRLVALPMSSTVATFHSPRASEAGG
jgi:hypothetical protein